MSYYVYAIESTSRRYIYVGLTSAIKARIDRHNAGYERTTKPYRPFRLIYFELVEDRPTARQREKYWKGSSGKKKLRFIADRLGPCGPV